MRYLASLHRLHSPVSVTPTELTEAVPTPRRCGAVRTLRSRRRTAAPRGPSGAARARRAPRRSRLTSPRARGGGRGGGAGGTRPATRGGGAKRAGPWGRSPRPSALWRTVKGAEPRRIPPTPSGAPGGRAGERGRARAHADWLPAAVGARLTAAAPPSRGKTKQRRRRGAVRSTARLSGCLGRPAALRRGDARRAPGPAYDPRPPPRAHAALCFRCPSLRAGREGPVRAPRRPPRGVRISVPLRERGPRRCYARSGAGECSAAAGPKAAVGGGGNGRGRGAWGATKAGGGSGGTAVSARGAGAARTGGGGAALFIAPGSDGSAARPRLPLRGGTLHNGGRSGAGAGPPVAGTELVGAVILGAGGVWQPELLCLAESRLRCAVSLQSVSGRRRFGSALFSPARAAEERQHLGGLCALASPRPPLRSPHRRPPATLAGVCLHIREPRGTARPRPRAHRPRPA